MFELQRGPSIPGYPERLMDFQCKKSNPWIEIQRTRTHVLEKHMEQDCPKADQVQLNSNGAEY